MKQKKKLADLQMSSDQHVHRPGPLKHKNKPFKSKFSTKGSFKKKFKGRVEAHVPGGRQNIKTIGKADTKLNRKNALKIEQQKKREELAQRLRSKSSVPRLCVSADLSQLKS